MKKYKINFELKAILLDLEYNQAVKFASDLMNEPVELSPYYVSTIVVSEERLNEPSEEDVETLKNFLIYQLKKNNKIILKSLNIKNIEILYYEEI